MTTEFYDRIAALTGVSGVFDTKSPDGYALTGCIVVVSSITENPLAATIEGTLALTEQRVTCEVQALDLPSARAVKQALIPSLHGFKAGALKGCAFESGGPELYDHDLVPPRYCLPVDFILTF